MVHPIPYTIDAHRLPWPCLQYKARLSLIQSEPTPRFCLYNTIPVRSHPCMLPHTSSSTAVFYINEELFLVTSSGTMKSIWVLYRYSIVEQYFTDLNVLRNNAHVKHRNRKWDFLWAGRSKFEAASWGKTKNGSVKNTQISSEKPCKEKRGLKPLFPAHLFQ